MRENDVVGIAGTRSIAGAAWECSDYFHLCGQVGDREAGEKGYAVTVYGVGEALSAPVQALDGPLLAARRNAAQRLGFDEETFDGRALCDLDFSLRASRSGLACATCNEILVVRDSPAGRDERWLSHCLRFMNKHKLERPREIFPQAELASVLVQSLDEWRLMTQHLIALGRLPAPAREES
jgi:GT2 family glycosyltransferase